MHFGCRQMLVADLQRSNDSGDGDGGSVACINNVINKVESVADLRFGYCLSIGLAMGLKWKHTYIHTYLLATHKYIYHRYCCTLLHYMQFLPRVAAATGRILQACMHLFWVQPNFHNHWCLAAQRNQYFRNYSFPIPNALSITIYVHSFVFTYLHTDIN